ncbi:MAG: hypothetical protein MUC59_13055 [Saprospiraceae bacterium]|nr:hypothetical protein [Saprospiraceae bacterium]
MNKLLHRAKARFLPSVCRKATIFRADFAGKNSRRGHTASGSFMPFG